MSDDKQEELKLSNRVLIELITASSLAATMPLAGLLKCLISEKVVDRDKLKSFIESALKPEKFSGETRQMLEPIWRSLLSGLDFE